MERCCRVWDVLAALGGGTPLLLGGGLPGGKGEGGGEEVRRKGRVVFAYRRGKESGRWRAPGAVYEGCVCISNRDDDEQDRNLGHD